MFLWRGQQTYRNKEEDHATERETAGVAQVPWNTQCDESQWLYTAITHIASMNSLTWSHAALY